MVAATIVSIRPGGVGVSVGVGADVDAGFEIAAWQAVKTVIRMDKVKRIVVFKVLIARLT
jgi:hypothetical protein